MRFILGLPVAAIITVALFLMMKAFISTEVPKGDVQAQVKFNIKPKVEELKVRKRQVKAERSKDVKPPPPPPQVAKQKAVQPKEGIANVQGAIPKFEAPRLSRNNVNFNVSDRDAQPLVRIPPMYPPRMAEQGKEGSCDADFDVSPEGKPYNVRVSCTNSGFASSAKRSVEKWKYNPKIVDGKAVSRVNVHTVITFKLAS